MMIETAEVKKGKKEKGRIGKMKKRERQGGDGNKDWKKIVETDKW